MKAFLFSIAVVCLVLTPIGSSLHAGWVENGIGVGDATLDQQYQSIIPDGSGGCFMTWEDRRTGIPFVYVQHLDRNGDELWTPGGKRVCMNPQSQRGPVLVADGNGGFIVAWVDNRTDWSIYAQKVDADGILQWGSTGAVAAPRSGWISAALPH